MKEVNTESYRKIVEAFNVIEKDQTLKLTYPHYEIKLKVLSFVRKESKV